MKTTKTMQKGGSKKDSMEDAAVKRYPNYLGKGTAYDSSKKGVKDSVKGAKTVAKTVVKSSPEYQAAKGTDDFLEKRYPNYFGKGTMYSKVKKGIKSVFQNGGTTKMKMVKKDGKMIPAFAADGKGKMMMGGAKPKAMYGKEIMQKGGNTSSNTTPVKKVTAKTNPVPKKVVPASSSDMKTFRLRNGYDTKGGKVESMKKGGIAKKK